MYTLHVYTHTIAVHAMAHVRLPSSQNTQSANNLHGPAYSLHTLLYPRQHYEAKCIPKATIRQNVPPPDSIMKQNAHLPSQQWQRADPNSPESIYVRVHECIYAVLRPMISADRPR